MYTSESFEIFLLYDPYITSFIPLYPSHGILNQMGWVSIIGDLSFLGLSLIPLDVNVAQFLASPLVSGWAKLSIDLTKNFAITPCLSNCLKKLSFGRISGLPL